MAPQAEDILRTMELAHFGKLMASLSHEFKNHLAIINESGGLMEDILLMDGHEQPVNRERFRKIIGTINERVSQAAEMCRHLSSFAHRTDHPLSSFSIVDVIREELYLLRRFAHQKQTELSFSGPQDLPPVFNNPSLLQFSLFCIIWPPLEHLDNGRISVSASKQSSGVEIAVLVTGKMPDIRQNPWRTILPEALNNLGAELSRQVRRDDYEESGVTISSIETSQSENRKT